MKKYSWYIILLFSAFVFSFLLLQPYLKGSVDGNILSFFGSIFAGVFTLVGVIVTILYNEASRNKNLKDNLELQRENLRIENYPILSFKIYDGNNIHDSSDDKIYSFNKVSFCSKEKIKIVKKLKIKNIGKSVCFNVELEFDTFGNKPLIYRNVKSEILPDETIVLMIDFNFSEDMFDNIQDYYIAFKYEDLLGNVYSKFFDCELYSYDGGNKEIFFDAEDKIYHENFYNFKTSSLEETKSKYTINKYYKGNNDFNGVRANIGKIKNIDEINKIVEYVDLKLSIFKKVSNLFADESKIDYRKIISDIFCISNNRIVETFIINIFSDEKSVVIKYDLIIDLKRKNAKFKNAGFISYLNISLIEYLKLRLIIKNVKINFKDNNFY